MVAGNVCADASANRTSVAQIAESQSNAINHQFGCATITIAVRAKGKAVYEEN